MCDAYKLTFTLTHTANSTQRAQTPSYASQAFWFTRENVVNCVEMILLIFNVPLRIFHFILARSFDAFGRTSYDVVLLCRHLHITPLCMRRRSTLWVAVNCSIEVWAARYGDSWSWLPKYVTSDFCPTGDWISLQCSGITTFYRIHIHLAAHTTTTLKQFFTDSFSISYTDRITNESKHIYWIVALWGRSFHSIVVICSQSRSLSPPLFALLFTEKWKKEKIFFECTFKSKAIAPKTTHVKWFLWNTQPNHSLSVLLAVSCMLRAVFRDNSFWAIACLSPPLHSSVHFNGSGQRHRRWRDWISNESKIRS